MKFMRRGKDSAAVIVTNISRHWCLAAYQRRRTFCFVQRVPSVPTCICLTDHAC